MTGSVITARDVLESLPLLPPLLPCGSRDLTSGSDGEMTVPLTLKELAATIGAELAIGDGSAAGGASGGEAGADAGALLITSAATLEDATAGQVSFLSNPKYTRHLETTRASAVVVAPNVARPANSVNPRLILLKARNPYYAFTQAVVALHGYRRHPHQGVHPAAHVDPTATIGEGTVLYPGVYVGPGTRVGRDCILYPNVVVYDGCLIGDRVIIHAGASIGHDGFGFATHKGTDGVAVHHKIPQIGNTVIEDDVEIGPNSTVSRGTLDSTVIGRGTKVGDAVAIGHGTRIGERGLLVSQVGIAGSATIGHHVTMAGQVGVAGHLTVGSNVTIGAQGGIISDVPDNVTLIGAPAMPALRARRVYSIFTQLPELLERIKELEERVEKLTGTAALDRSPELREPTGGGGAAGQLGGGEQG